MPKVEHAGRERPILAAEASVQQANDDIGIVLAPSAVVRIEAVNAIEIRLPNTKVARPRALPNPLANAPQRAKRQMQQRRQSIDAAAPPFGESVRTLEHGRLAILFLLRGLY